MTGDCVSHVIIAGGPFDVACQKLLATDFSLAWFDRYPSADMLVRRGDFRKYTPEEIEAAARERGESDASGEGGIDLTQQVPPKPSYGDPVAPLEGDPVNLKALADQGIIKVIAQREKKNASKTKYTCPQCKTNIWAKPGLNAVCGKDSVRFVSISESIGDTDEFTEAAESAVA